MHTATTYGYSSKGLPDISHLFIRRRRMQRKSQLKCLNGEQSSNSWTCLNQYWVLLQQKNLTMKENGRLCQPFSTASCTTRESYLDPALANKISSELSELGCTGLARGGVSSSGKGKFE